MVHRPSPRQTERWRSAVLQRPILGRPSHFCGVGCAATPQSLWFLSRRRKAASAAFSRSRMPLHSQVSPSSDFIIRSHGCGSAQSTSRSPVKHGAGIQIPTLPTSLVALSSWRLQAPFLAAGAGGRDGDHNGTDMPRWPPGCRSMSAECSAEQASTRRQPVLVSARTWRFCVESAPSLSPGAQPVPRREGRWLRSRGWWVLCWALQGKL